jgi:hypothetical protein
MRYLRVDVSNSNGDFISIGEIIGKVFKKQIEVALSIDDCFLEVKEWCMNDGIKVFNDMKNLNKELYPLLWLHLQALAKGCDQTFDDILVLNFLPELDPLKNLSNIMIEPNHPDVRGCTDIHVAAGWGHSED